MKILQVNAVYKTKSTGRITMELHNYFKSKGIESYVAYATENTDECEDSHIFQVGNLLDHKLHAIAYRIDKLQGCHSNIATKKFLKKIKDINPDIVLTHNLHANFLNVPMFLKELNKMNIKIFLALHDCWFLTGGCYHYTARKCNQWLTGCKTCKLLGKAAEKKYKLNCQVFEMVHPYIIATSKWIEHEAKRSLLGSRSGIFMIYDWIDLKTFYPRNDREIRNKLGIGNRKMILGVSTVWTQDKGQEEMYQIAMEMPEASVVMVGDQPRKAFYPDNVITISFTDSKEQLAEIYSAADVFFNPSKQETFGLVSGEALACGTPLVVYNTTACPEFITKYTGIIVEDKNGIVEAVRKTIELNEKYGRNYVRQKCRSFAEKNFSMNTNIDKYIECFKNAIGEK